jgi:hypothetical protein
LQSIEPLSFCLIKCLTRETPIAYPAIYNPCGCCTNPIAALTKQQIASASASNKEHLGQQMAEMRSFGRGGCFALVEGQRLGGCPYIYCGKWRGMWINVAWIILSPCHRSPIASPLPRNDRRFFFAHPTAAPPPQQKKQNFTADRPTVFPTSKSTPRQNRYNPIAIVKAAV